MIIKPMIICQMEYGQINDCHSENDLYRTVHISQRTVSATNGYIYILSCKGTKQVI